MTPALSELGIDFEHATSFSSHEGQQVPPLKGGVLYVRVNNMPVDTTVEVTQDISPDVTSPITPTVQKVPEAFLKAFEPDSTSEPVKETIPTVRKIVYELRPIEPIPEEKRAWVGTITDEDGTKRGVFGDLVGRTGQNTLDKYNQKAVEMKLYIRHDPQNPNSDALKLGKVVSGPTGAEIEITQVVPEYNALAYEYSGWWYPKEVEVQMTKEELQEKRKNEKYPQLNQHPTVDLRDKRITALEPYDDSYKLVDLDIIPEEISAFIGTIIDEDGYEDTVYGDVVGRTARLDDENNVLVVDEYIRFDPEEKYLRFLGNIKENGGTGREVVIRRYIDADKADGIAFSGRYEKKKIQDQTTKQAA